MFGSLCIVVPLGSVQNQSVFKDAVIARSTRWLTRPGSQPRSHPDVAHQIPASLRSPARLPACPPACLRRSSFSSASSRRCRRRHRRSALQARTEKETTEEGKWRACFPLFCYEVGKNTYTRHTVLQILSQICLLRHATRSAAVQVCTNWSQTSWNKPDRFSQWGLDVEMKPVFWLRTGVCSESWTFVFSICTHFKGITNTEFEKIHVILIYLKKFNGQ